MADAEEANLAETLSLFDEYWSPKIVAGSNGRYVKLVDEFAYHQDEGDEQFFVIEGRLGMGFRDRDVLLEEGEMSAVPRGAERRAVAEGGVHV